MNERSSYAYASSVKSGVSDELINTYLLRPLAGLLVRILYPTPVTPNHVTMAATIAGLVASFFYAAGTAQATVVAGLLLTLKDILDSADGQLARARQRYSRAGRFLDSIGDIVVNSMVFLAIGISLAGSGYGIIALPVSLLAGLCLTLRVSYHVFYQTSFLHLQNLYLVNRTTEELREEDRQAEPWTVRLQRLFLALYGWQDNMMVKIDHWSRYGRTVDPLVWYGNRTALRWSGLLGLGTELFLLMIFSVAHALPQYLLVNLVGMNAVWVGCMLFRRRLARKLTAS